MIVNVDINFSSLKDICYRTLRIFRCIGTHLAIYHDIVANEIPHRRQFVIPSPIPLVPAHPVQAQLTGALSTSTRTGLALSAYHSPRIRRTSPAINHYYPDRTHSRRVPHSSPSRLASRRSFIHAWSVSGSL
jgi:hypothetical protein